MYICMFTLKLCKKYKLKTKPRQTYCRRFTRKKFCVNKKNILDNQSFNIMESALDVLSRAATMVQDNANETRLTSKELPTSTWRRERRLRTGEYHHPHHHPSPSSSASSARASSPSSSPPPAAHVQHSPISSGSISTTNTHIHSNAHQISIMMAAAAATANIRPLNESNNRSSPPSPSHHSTSVDQIHLGQIAHSQVLQHINSIQNDDAPLDMSVGSLKHRNSPPPPYREPLPGSQFASSLARPSVITQAPPKRDIRDPTSVSNRENDNRSCESIDEHFRRSLGNDYFALFSKKSAVSQSTKASSPQPQLPETQTTHVRNLSPTLPLSCGTSDMPPHSALKQSEIVPPTAYSVNLPIGNHQQNTQQSHQNQTLVTSKANTVLLSQIVVAGQMKGTTGPISPPLPLVVRQNVQPKHQQPICLQKSSSFIATSPLTSPQSPAPIPGAKLGNTVQMPLFTTSGSRTVSPLPLHQHQQQSSSAALTLSHFASMDDSPSSSPQHTPPVLNVPVLHPSPSLPAIMRIKTEPGLQIIKPHNPTPPASPTSTTNHNINSNSTNYSSNASSPSPSSPITSSWKSSTNPVSTSAEVLASVDDHFAKALGDTWKKLQESKEIRK